MIFLTEKIEHILLKDKFSLLQLEAFSLLILTHLWLMECPTFTNWTGPFPFKGGWVVFFIFIQILINRTCCSATDKVFDSLMPELKRAHNIVH